MLRVLARLPDKTSFEQFATSPADALTILSATKRLTGRRKDVWIEQDGQQIDADKLRTGLSRTESRTDLATLAERLSAVEAYVDMGERHIARQREIVASLERGGHAALSQAIALLATFEASQALHVAIANRLRREVGRTSK